MNVKVHRLWPRAKTEDLPSSALSVAQLYLQNFKLYFEFHLVQILILMFMLIFTFLDQERNFKCKENSLNNVLTVFTLPG